MITKSKVTEIFVLPMISAKNLMQRWQKNAVQSTPDTPKRRRKHMMSDAEVITVLHLFPLRLQLLPQLQALLPGLCVRFSDGFELRGYMW